MTSHHIQKLIKMDIDINVRAKTVKILEENTGVNLHALELSNGFLDMTPKAQTTKEKKTC